MSFVYFTAIDPSIGKIDKSALSQQTLMELFVDGITNKERFCGLAHHPRDLSEWRELYLNDSGDVIKFDVFSYYLRGSIALEWLPLSAQIINMRSNFLSGTLDLEHLPDGLTLLYLNSNQFVGSVCLTNLPECLETLFLHDNRLEGAIDLTCLPKTLGNLDLRENRFVGETDFSRLPDALYRLNVSHTELSGEIRKSTTRCDTVIKSNVEVIG
uniref:Leucine-rich repeat protein n=1 Tax=Paramoeba aestuarina TaxID=180227 RepID=A0A7S4NKW1_9EUKA|mmetsp:Transcript_18704/g.29334  ORF Transcript_18704/g.29334 Transcript_18704/m.29334 type:complete len:213 (+) Transcript_18704:28-666(+)